MRPSLCGGIPALLLLAACSGLPSEPDNPVVVEHSWGLCTGATAEEVRVLADVVETTRPLLAEAPGFVDRPLRIHVFPTSLPHDWSGITAENGRGDAWIAVNRGSEHFENNVAHELTHFYLSDLLDRLPPIVEEGFCEVIANRAYPAPVAKKWRLIVAAVSYLDRFTVHVDGPLSKARLGYLVQPVPPIEVALAVDAAELPLIEPRAREAYYGIGWVVADTLGLEGLAELDARREDSGLEGFPVAWILSETDLAPLNQENLRAAFARALGARPGAEGRPLTITLEDD